MLVIRDLADAAHVRDPEIRQLVEQRINDLGGEAFDAEELGYFLVVESGDTLQAINAQIGFNILCNRIDGIAFGSPGYYPSFEFIEDFQTGYDMVFVVSDDGFGIELVIPKTAGAVPELLAMCARYATPPFPDAPPS